MDSAGHADYIRNYRDNGNRLVNRANHVHIQTYQENLWLK